MGACRYGISPRVSNVLAHERTQRTIVEHEEGNSISRSNHVFFTNTKGLDRQEDSI